MTSAWLQDCPGLYVLEALAVQAGLPTTCEVLQRVGAAPILTAFAPRKYQVPKSWDMKDAAAVDPRMN